MLPAMSLNDWLRRHRWLIFARPEVDATGDEGAALREEYGEAAQQHTPSIVPPNLRAGPTAMPDPADSELEVSPDDVDSE
jgi:hypothetical protein